MQVDETRQREQQLSDDFAWAQEAPEVQQNPDHFGKLVVVHDRRILAVGRDRPAILERAAREAGVSGQQLVVVLVPRPGPWEIPH
jgi:hypothetical protein